MRLRGVADGASDAGMVAVSAAAWAGATMSRPFSLAFGVAAVAAGFGLRRVLPLAVGVLLLASALAARAWAGLEPPSPRTVDEWVSLVGDPVRAGGALRADVRLDGRRYEAWARGDAAATLAPRQVGDRILVGGSARPPPADARARLAVRHVAGRITIDDVMAVRSATGITGVANAMRRRLVHGARSLPSSERALLLGIVLGDDRDQPPEMVDDFRGAGLSHLLAVSGQNVAFTMVLAAPLLRTFGRRLRIVGAVGVLLLFGTLTRWEPSVLRASAMAAVALAAAARGRRQTALRVLALAVTACVLVDPILVHAAGFRLSVAATAGIALVAPYLAAALPGPRWLAIAVAVPVAAELAVAPILVALFGQVPLVSLPANLAAAVVAGPLMTWGMAVGFVAGFMPGAMAAVVHLPTRALVVVLATIARVAAAAPLPTVGATAVIAAAVALALWLWSPRRRAVIAGGLVTLAAMHLLLTNPAPLWERTVASGVVAWRDGGATVIALDRARPLDALAGLREAGVRGIDLVVLGTDGGAAALAAIEARHQVGAVAIRGSSRFAGIRIPMGGGRLRVGALTVTVIDDGRRLTTNVARGPPAPRR
jgi:competence protein ComEC